MPTKAQHATKYAAGNSHHHRRLRRRHGRHQCHPTELGLSAAQGTCAALSRERVHQTIPLFVDVAVRGFQVLAHWLFNGELCDPGYKQSTLDDVVLGEAYQTGQALDVSVRFLDRVIDALAEDWQSQSFGQVLQAFINLRRFFDHSPRGNDCLINLFVQRYGDVVRTIGDTAVAGLLITKEDIEVLEEVVNFLEEDAKDLGTLTKALMLQKIGHFEGQAHRACAYHAHEVEEACYRVE
ncbi:hypothetical protein LTR86_009722 [Recurvomyces mirabilis]|nr:hypothetical protein LTR86_009722 [Recurvomyces mirabilis]